MREAFDRSFAEAPAVGQAAAEKFLAVRLGGDAYALRVSEIAGLFVDRQVTPVPTPSPSLLGLAAFRGVTAPVYDLAMLLGYAGTTSPRWLVLVRAAFTVGLALERFEGHLSGSPVDGAEASGDARPVRGVIGSGELARPIIQVASVLEAISRWRP
jgi:purine-binding chemotaxis protein CheW